MARARRSFGSIQDMPGGRLRGRYRVRSRDYYTPVRRTRRSVEADLTLVEATILNGTWVPPRRRRRTAEKPGPDAPLYVREWAELWMIELQAEGRSPNTVRSYRSNLSAHIVPVLGEKRVRDLTSDDLQLVVDEMTGSRVTRQNVVRTFTSMINAASERDKPVAPIKPPTIPATNAPRKRRQALTAEQLDAVIAAASSPAFAAAFALAGWCCLRYSEVAALQRADIDLERWTVTVERGVKRGPKGAPVVGAPKSARSYRTVSIPPRARDVIEAHMRDVEPGRDALVFTGGWGGYMSDRVMRGELHRSCARAGVPRIGVHELRHTGLTLFGLAGATAAELMARAGHSDIQTAMIYQHASAQRDRELAERLG